MLPPFHTRPVLQLLLPIPAWISTPVSPWHPSQGPPFRRSPTVLVSLLYRRPAWLLHAWLPPAARRPTSKGCWGTSLCFVRGVFSFGPSSGCVSIGCLQFPGELAHTTQIHRPVASTCCYCCCCFRCSMLRSASGCLCCPSDRPQPRVFAGPPTRDLLRHCVQASERTCCLLAPPVSHYSLRLPGLTSSLLPVWWWLTVQLPRFSRFCPVAPSPQSIFLHFRCLPGCCTGIWPRHSPFFSRDSCPLTVALLTR